MTLPIVIPASNSPASDDSRTPLSPTETSQQSTASATANNKRKPSRRANTAERRATHNAVERQRRETLNGRFFDLAQLLPNLSQIRRPSKSSIVNSSIAHIHASRRHRLLAARELRALKVEADALRRELNEWRDRSGIPRVEEPVRSEGFSMILSGELEVLVVPGMINGVIEEEDDDYSGTPEDTYPADSQEVDDPRLAMIKNANLVQNGSSSPPSNASSSPPYAHRPSISVPQQPVLGGPMIASPTAMSFENPAMAGVYSPADSHIPQQGHVIYHSQHPYPMHPPQMGPHPMMDPEKVAQWNMMQQQQVHQMNVDQLYLASLARRGRSASISTGSRSSGSVSPVQTYDIPPQFESGFEPGFEGSWSHGGGMGGKQQPVFAMMM